MKRGERYARFPVVPLRPQRLHLAQDWMARWYLKYSCPAFIHSFLYSQTFAESF